MLSDVAATPRARVGVAVVFFINGFGVASWVPRIAEVKAALGLGEAELGFALLAIATGALPALATAGVLSTRFGSRVVTTVALLLFLVAPIGWAFAPDLAWLALGFLAIGVTAGALDVAMNTQGAAVEDALAKPIMSSLHGMFSLGSMAGALASGAFIAAGVPLLAHMAIVAALALPPGLLACAVMLPAAPDVHGGAPVFTWPGRGLVLLGLIAFCALLTEGAVADWSAVYITESLGGPGELAALAFAAFQLTMAAGRFLGDRLITRFGRKAVTRTGGLLAGLSLAAALVVAHPVAAIAGFALVGAGIATIFPITVSTAAGRGEMAPGHAIAAVSTIGCLGFLVGPPAVGLTAEVAGLPAALGLLPLLCLVVVGLARTLRPPAITPDSASAGR